MISKIISGHYLARPLCSRLTKSSTKSFLRGLSSLPITVKVSPGEVASSSLTLQNLELATRALHRDGLVVLEDVIDHAKLDKLNTRMSEDAYTLQAKGDASPFNYNKGCVGCSRRNTCPTLIKALKKHPTRSTHDWTALWVYYPAQQACDSSYLLGAWTKTSALICFRKQCPTTYARLTSAVSASPLRCWLWASKLSFCTSDQHSPCGYDTWEWFNGGLAWNPCSVLACCTGRQARRAGKRTNQDILAWEACARASAGTACCQERITSDPRPSPLACWKTKPYRRNTSDVGDDPFCALVQVSTQTFFQLRSLILMLTYGTGTPCKWNTRKISSPHSRLMKTHCKSRAHSSQKMRLWTAIWIVDLAIRITSIKKITWTRPFDCLGPWNIRYTTKA